jgi:hypothetical protein
MTMRRPFPLYKYFAIDGGSGAHLLAALSNSNPYLQPVASPRHANLLIVIEPISQKLVPALMEIAQSIPQPAHVLIVDVGAQIITPNTAPDNALHHIVDSFNEGHIGPLLPGARHITTTEVDEVLRAIFDSDQVWPELTIHPSQEQETELTTIQLPSKQKQELATELVVLSLGPVQPFTAGPLRILLICDGEQVLTAQIESGFTHRAITEAMLHADWQAGLHLARDFDPLAPLAGELAYVRAIEQLQGRTPTSEQESLREAALALERAQNMLWWLVRFAQIANDARLTEKAYALATMLTTCMYEFINLTRKNGMRLNRNVGAQ